MTDDDKREQQGYRAENVRARSADADAPRDLRAKVARRPPNKMIGGDGRPRYETK